MSEASFEKSNLAWQFGLLQRRFGEWLELQFKNVNIPGVPNFSVSPQLLEILFWTIVLAFAIWVIWRLTPLFVSLWFNASNASNNGIEKRSPDLSTKHTVAEWLKLAQKSQQAGNYAEACRALYLAMVQRLHDTKIALHDPSRSDGEYLQVTQRLSPSEPYQTLIQTHESICFGDAGGSEDTYQLCQQAYREIDPQ
jgi:hypothetical protein